MLLTLSQQSGKPDFGAPSPHAFASPPLPRPNSHYSPRRHVDHVLSGLPPHNNYVMSTSHRGLPPPSAMALPEPNRQQQQQQQQHQQQPQPPPPPPPPTSSLQQHQQQPQLGSMPAPPSQWSGGEESMRHWLSTKAEEERTKQEEERRRQEEEKTRQESYRLEQRLVEQSMLRESMKGGVPPQMIPVIFAGIGGSNLVNASVEMLHQYAAQLQSSQQQMQALELGGSEQPRETRINPPQALYLPPQQQQQQQQTPSASSQPVAPIQQHQTTFPAYSASSRPSAPTSAPRSVPTSGLSRINTVDIAQPSSTAPSLAQHSNTSQVGPSDQPTSSPSIYFHHWVPPATQDSKGNQPPTPSGKNEPSSAHPSHAEGDYRDSPRKRKATGGHHPNPPPSQTSPSFSSQSSNRSRRNSNGHIRSRSNKSNEDHTEASRRPPSRRDSVATQPRIIHEPGYGPPDPHSRPPSHASHHPSPQSRREHMR
ncbi:hypothetical protein CAC42_2920 [Sphaceloma murrayae]|uniref:Uncharacterized protein n=1 Tax=Sphaceloma murrayae TaxID=2082308 RepID=A0A2K1R044_9PEZI|nr:hypothetical protein CAC42_2920 [Sphaceloma murrayae]